MSNKEQLIKNLRNFITGHGSEEVENAKEPRTEPSRHARKSMGEAYEEAFYEGKGWRAALGDRSLRSKRGKQEVLRSRKSGERDSYSDNKQFDRDRNWGKWSKTKSDFSANRTRRDKNDYENNVNSQNSSAPRSKPNRHDRKRMGEEAELEEMKARRSVYRYSDGSTVVNRSRKSGENNAWADNSPMGRRDHKKSQERSGKKTGSLDDIYKKKGVHGQDAERPRVRPSRHARKRMAEGYYWSNVDLGYAISEALGHKVKGAIQKAKEVYTKGTKKQQERGIAQANKEAEKNAAARRNK